MKIVLVRHGETTANVERLFCGHTDVKLTEKGIEQAKKAADKLAPYSFTKIISSDLSRAYDTASIINQHHHLPIEQTKTLREFNFGAWEGYTYDQILALKPKSFEDNGIGRWAFTFPEGENLELLTNRVMKQIKYIRSEMHKEDIVLIVTHSGVIRSVLTMEISNNKEAYWRYDIDNCGIVELNYFDNFCVLSKLNA